MKKIYINLLLSVLIIPFFTGCASLSYRMNPSEYDHYIEPGVYPGVRLDSDNIENNSTYKSTASNKYPQPLISGISIFDLPLSFILDTVCLPYDMFQSNKNKEE